MLLSSDWTVSGGTPDGKHTFSVPAAVPGCLTADLRRAGLIPDPYWRTNADGIQWIEDCDAVYRCVFTPDRHYARPALTFLGLDTYAEIFLNGRRLGESDNMFRRLRLAAEGLTDGENVLEIRFRSPVREVAGLPKREGAFTTERLYTRRMQCTYGWDWVGRFVTVGVWRNVLLTETEPDRLGYDGLGVAVRTENVNPFSAQLALRLDWEDVTGDGFVTLTIRDPEGRRIWTKRRRILRPVTEERLDVPAPRLWYPAGYGRQPLYTLTVSAPHEERTLRFGIRTITLLQTEDEPGGKEALLSESLRKSEHLAEWDRNEGSSRFTVLVNDVPVFCQGANWVPCEPFPSEETPEKIRSLVRLARFAGVNMLRVWGGGIFENDEFYSACDEEGILVTQDFLMACGVYPEEDPAFLAQLRLEAKEGAYLLRNHACLAWWSGDNENAVAGDENMPVYPGSRAGLDAIGPVLAELDPSRRFLPSSPYGGVPFASATRGTSHNTQYLGNFFAWIRKKDFSDYQRYFHRYLTRFCAEQPTMGMPYLSTLRKFLTEEDVFGTDQTVSEYHTKTNPGLGAVTLFDYVNIMAEGIFGAYRDGKDRLRKMQWLQCEWVRQSFELFRRNQWYSSGLIYWMWDDCWPAANSWSFADYYRCPKPAMYAFRRCARPFLLSIDGDAGTSAEVWASYNGNPADAPRLEGTLRLYRYDLVTGEEDRAAECGFSLAAGETAAILTAPLPPADAAHVWLADAETNVGSDRAVLYPLRPADLRFPDAEVTLLAQDAGSVTLYAPETIPFAVWDPEGVPLEDAGFFLKKGETRTVRKYPAP